MKRPTLEIQIEEVVVSGRPRGAERALREAISTELARSLPAESVDAVDIEAIAQALVERLGS